MSLRIVTVFLLLLHGLIHLIGVFRPWKMPDASRMIGTLWLVVTVTLATAAVLRLMNRDVWWVFAGPAIVLSQVLIVLQWQDAWAGTALNALLAVLVAAGAGTERFHASNRDHARALLARAPTGQASILRSADVSALPPPVRRWLQASGAIGRPQVRTVRLRQRGGLRTAPDQAYMHAEAEQYFIVDEPGFVWTVDVTMMGVVPVVGRDLYVDGAGRMFIKAAGLVTVADGTGPAFDQGTALRFLGEIIWFPSAALAPYISWEPVDDRQARATITFKDVVASAVFEFDERGRVTGMAARRYYNGQSLETWVIPIKEWKTMRGIEMPVKGGAVWKLHSGDFDYYQWEILDVETNVTSLWGEG